MVAIEKTKGKLKSTAQALGVPSDFGSDYSMTSLQAINEESKEIGQKWI